MPIVIRNGTLLTMVDEEPLQADLLLEGGRIQRIGKRLAVCENTRSLDASGCVIIPGLIDLQMNAEGEEYADIHCMAGKAGVTTGLCWPPRQGECLGFGMETSKRFARIDPQSWTDEELCSELRRISKDSLPVIHVCDAAMCRRVLRACTEEDCKALLAGLGGCGGLLEEIAGSGCPVVIGVQESDERMPWRFAADLQRCGVMVALSTRYPTASLKKLRFYASLCFREGVSRRDALRMITSIPAKILGSSDRGFICEGAMADLCIYDGDPLLLATSHLMTVVSGRIMMAK